MKGSISTRVFRFFIAIALALLLVPATPLPARASGDDEIAPVLKSVSISQNEATKPGAVRIALGVEENETGIVHVHVTLKHISVSDASIDSCCFDCRYSSRVRNPLYTGTYSFDIPIPADSRVGEYRVCEVVLEDDYNNYSSYYTRSSSPDVLTKTGIDEGVPSPHIIVKDEFDYAFISGTTNPSLVANLKAMESDKTARIQVQGEGILPKGVFDAIRGTDKTIVCYKDAYQWIFKGKDIVNPSKDIDLSLDVKNVKAAEFGSDLQAAQITFPSNGLLPGKAQVRFKSDYLYKFKNIKGSLGVYYIDDGEVIKEDSDLDLVFDGTDKWCYMYVTHNSKFMVSPKALKSVSLQAAANLSRDAYTVTGKSIKPSVKVKLGGKSLVKGRDYTVTYGANKAVGKGTVKIKGAGAYKKAASATLTFKIVPKAATAKAAASLAPKSATLSWAKPASAVTGYQVQVSLDKTFKRGVKVKSSKGASVLSGTIKGLRSGKRYYAHVRAYKTVKGTKYYSAWSRVKTVKVA